MKLNAKYFDKQRKQIFAQREGCKEVFVNDALILELIECLLNNELTMLDALEIAVGQLTINQDHATLKEIEDELIGEENETSETDSIENAEHATTANVDQESHDDGDAKSSAD